MSSIPCQITKIITTFTQNHQTPEGLGSCGYSIIWEDITS
jgi:hypothetical protein